MDEKFQAIEQALFNKGLEFIATIDNNSLKICSTKRHVTARYIEDLLDTIGGFNILVRDDYRNCCTVEIHSAMNSVTKYCTNFYGQRIPYYD
jgi:hypothetical protein